VPYAVEIRVPCCAVCDLFIIVRVEWIFGCLVVWLFGCLVFVGWLFVSGLGYTYCCRLPLAATLGLVAMVGMYDLSSKEREWVQNTYSAYGTTVGSTTRAGGFWRAIPVPRSVINCVLGIQVFRRVDCKHFDPPPVGSAFRPIN
jgi:hypothetical protein